MVRGETSFVFSTASTNFKIRYIVVSFTSGLVLARLIIIEYERIRKNRYIKRKNETGLFVLLIVLIVIKETYPIFAKNQGDRFDFVDQKLVIVFDILIQSCFWCLRTNFLTTYARNIKRSFKEILLKNYRDPVAKVILNILKILDVFLMAWFLCGLPL